MTIAATVLGMLPLVFVTSAGAESRFTLGLVITTGLSISTLFTLFVVLILYLLISADRQKGRLL